MAIKIVFDKSYNISEYEVDPSWKNYVSEVYKDYRKKWDRASKGHLYQFPLCVEIESSYYCNLKCPVCVRQALGTFNEKGFFDRGLYAKLLNEASKHKMPALMLDHEAEPLTNPDIADMTREAKEAGIIDIWMHTNANLLTEEISEKLIKNGLTKINFSIDAVTEETYNQVRPGGNFNKVIKNIINFLKLKGQFRKKYLRTRVSFVTQDKNKQERGDFFEFWKGKVNVISFQELLDFTKFSNIQKSYKKMNVDFVCFKIWQLLIIRYNGDVVPCGMPFRHYNPKEYLLGNIYVNSIKECWNSSKLNKMRQLLLKRKYDKLSFCRDCVCAYTNIS
jgi:radical SAM protein with 4Fe4S-binding SPASM domain